jgi:hypothetical protein
MATALAVAIFIWNKKQRQPELRAGKSVYE